MQALQAVGCRQSAMLHVTKSMECMSLSAMHNMAIGVESSYTMHCTACSVTGMDM